MDESWIVSSILKHFKNSKDFYVMAAEKTGHILGKIETIDRCFRFWMAMGKIDVIAPTRKIPCQSVMLLITRNRFFKMKIITACNPV